jgi:hypothetical protein
MDMVVATSTVHTVHRQGQDGMTKDVCGCNTSKKWCTPVLLLATGHPTPLHPTKPIISRPRLNCMITPHSKLWT